MARHDDILNELRTIGPEIAATSTALSRLYDRRVDLFREARTLDPPIPNRDVAAAAGVSEVAVMKARQAAAKTRG